MKSIVLNLLERLTVLVLLLCPVFMQATQPTYEGRNFWGTSLTPIKVAFTYSSNSMYFSKGDTLEFGFKIYINKSDTVNYQANHQYLINLIPLHPLVQENVGSTLWRCIASTVSSDYIILDDDNCEYTGNATITFKKNKVPFSAWIDTFRLTDEVQDYLGRKYDYISFDNYKADQSMSIPIKNPYFDLLYDDEVNQIDHDPVNQQKLKQAREEKWKSRKSNYHPSP